MKYSSCYLYISTCSVVQENIITPLRASMNPQKYADYFCQITIVSSHIVFASIYKVGVIFWENLFLLPYNV